MNEKELLGYKMIDEKYHQALAVFLTGGKFTNLSNGINTLINNDKDIERLKDAGILHWVTPIYKEESIKICGCPVEFDMPNERVLIDGVHYSKHILKDISNLLSHYNKHIKSLNVGCNSQGTVDLKTIDNILNRLK